MRFVCLSLDLFSAAGESAGSDFPALLLIRCSDLLGTLTWLLLLEDGHNAVASFTK